MHGDGNGLYLRVTGSGSRSWMQRIVIHGRRRDLGLGGYPAIGLAEARALALANEALVTPGRDPLAERHRANLPMLREIVSPSSGIGWNLRSYVCEVASPRATLRIVFFETPKITGELLDRNALHLMIPTNPRNRLHNQHLPLCMEAGVLVLWTLQSWLIP